MKNKILSSATPRFIGCALGLLVLSLPAWSQVDSQTVVYTDTMSLNIYYPLSQAGNPCIIMIHGGGYIEGDRSDYSNMCRMFAERDVVGITIDYRLGGIISQLNGLYYSMEDAGAAIDWAMDHANYYGIDTARIYVGGSSAGSATAMAMIYFSPADWQEFAPSYAPLDWYYPIKGVVNEWGQIPASVIDEEEMKPMISFHGALDSVADIDSSIYDGIVAYGSRMIDQLLQAHNVRSELWIDSGGGHRVFSDSFRVEKIMNFFFRKSIVGVKDMPMPREKMPDGERVNLLGQVSYSHHHPSEHSLIFLLYR